MGGVTMQLRFVGWFCHDMLSLSMAFDSQEQRACFAYLVVAWHRNLSVT
jgi:hypothetical protein